MTVDPSPTDTSGEPTLIDPPLAEQSAVTLAEVFRALAHPIRVQLLDIIAAAPHEFCTRDLTGPVARSASTISRHLRVLQRVGLVVGDRRGRFVYYRAEHEALRALQAALAPREPSHPRHRTPFVVSLVGPSGVGKTTLVERLVPRITNRGLRVGTIKHAPHGHDVDQPGSDSSRHRAAGANPVLLAGAGAAVVFITTSPTSVSVGAHHQPVVGSEQSGGAAFAELRDHLTGCDVVLAEGYAALSDVTIELERTGIQRKSITSDTTPWFAISDRPGADTVGFDDLDVVVERIVASARSVASGPAHEPARRW